MRNFDFSFNFQSRHRFNAVNGQISNQVIFIMVVMSLKVMYIIYFWIIDGSCVSKIDNITAIYIWYILFYLFILYYLFYYLFILLFIFYYNNNIIFFKAGKNANCRLQKKKLFFCLNRRKKIKKYTK